LLCCKPLEAPLQSLSDRYLLLALITPPAAPTSVTSTQRMKNAVDISSKQVLQHNRDRVRHSC